MSHFIHNEEDTAVRCLHHSGLLFVNIAHIYETPNTYVRPHARQMTLFNFHSNLMRWAYSHFANEEKGTEKYLARCVTANVMELGCEPTSACFRKTALVENMMLLYIWKKPEQFEIPYMVMSIRAMLGIIVKSVSFDLRVENLSFT